jgi:hypothetical protein
MDFFEDIGRFLWAVINNWAGYTTGGVIVAALWLWSTVKQVPISRKSAILVAAFFLLVAIFNAWRDQRTALLNAIRERNDVVAAKEKEIGELQQQLDELKVLIIRVAFVDTPVIGIDPRDAKSTEFIIGLNIVNTGAPTALWGFTMRIVLSNGSEFNLKPLNSTVKPLQITDANGKPATQMSPQNYLPIKVGETPIPHNGRASGYLPYGISGIRADDFAKLGADMYITFFDVNGKPYTVQGRYTP